ncbi:MAG: VCBS repeat-containing protein [Planctomycetota bacterium]
MRAVVLLALLAAVARGDSLKRIQTLKSPFALASMRAQDLDGDGAVELIWVGRRGELRTLAWSEARGRFAAPVGSSVLPHPTHTLLSLADLEGDKELELVALTPSGTFVYSRLADGAFETKGRRAARRARLRLRTNHPRFADITQDLNGDDRADLIVPLDHACEMWLNGGAPGADGNAGGSQLRRIGTIAVDVERWRRMRSEVLSDRLTDSFSIPQLRTADVNGDGRADLIVKHSRTRSWHMQREDGTIPAEPDVFLDLRIFRDTSPEAVLRPGRILAGSNRARFQERDLDGDKIPDYIIAHRRKVWVFHGDKNRPQFSDPSTILKVSDELSGMIAVNLDNDELPDLLLFKVQIPSVSSLVLGALRSWNVQIRVLGYANDGGRKFERAPKWRNDLTVELPPLLKLIRQRAELLKRFENVTRQFGKQRVANVLGNQSNEVLSRNEVHNRIDVWRSSKDGGESIDLEAMMREIFFEDKNTRWDIDRFFNFMSSMANREAMRLTGGRDPDLSVPLRDPSRFTFVDWKLADFDGDGRDEILVEYESRTRQDGVIFDVIRAE